MKAILYWLLLLVPTVLLGIFGWKMLRQEEARLAEAAELARTERAKIVADNVALFLDEARGGIIAGLTEIRADEIHEGLQAWAEANPLVRETFVWRPHAGVIASAVGSADPSSSLLRRYPTLLAPRSRWETEETGSPPEALLRGEQKEPPAQGERDAAYLDQTPRQALRQMADDARMANFRRQEATGPGFERELAADRAISAYAETAGATAPSAAAAPNRARALVPEGPRVTSSGWITFFDVRPFTAIAWVELQPGGEIRGAEVDLGGILTRMLAVLPGAGAADTYRLIDHRGEPFPSGGMNLLHSSAHQLELSDLLPGWRLSFEPGTGSYSSGSRGFFVLSSLLLAVALAAIVSGGSLLLHQAHRHRLDARQKSSFVSNVSHELKTPLTTIRMYAELMGEGRVRDEAHQRKYLNIIITESQRLTRLINNVLDFSRLEQAQKSGQIQNVSLATLLLPILDAQQIRLEAAGLSLHRHLPPEDPMVRTDPDAFEQAVLNLLDNAIKYAADGGELEVTAMTGDNGICIHFMDRGPGIETKQRKHLFEKFHRCDTSLTAAQPGCGLGLNIARRLLRRAGGDLTHSPRPGGGACFTITLPLPSPTRNLKPET